MFNPFVKLTPACCCASATERPDSNGHKQVQSLLSYPLDDSLLSCVVKAGHEPATSTVLGGTLPTELLDR